jgi:hypothetical protein
MLPVMLFPSSGQRTRGPSRDAAVIALVRAAYQREFGLAVDHPAIYNNVRAVDCRGGGHLTTTAYVRTGSRVALYSMYMSRDGSSVIAKTRSSPALLPGGTIRVLVALVQYPGTGGANALRLWQRAQARINADHVTLAKRLGYRNPAVVFDNTNVAIDATEVEDPSDPATVRRALERHGASPASFAIVMTIDINPHRRAGGFSLLGERSVYVGNFSGSPTPLDEQQWLSVARAAYHHEVAHHWGWPGDHDWAATCGNGAEFQPFFVPPLLFGWSDLDGDHVADILAQ